MTIEAERPVTAVSVVHQAVARSTFQVWWRSTFDAAVRVSNYHAASMNAKIELLRLRTGDGEDALAGQASR